MAENGRRPLCAYCKIHRQADRVFFAHACRSCARTLMRVVMVLHGRHPDTGKPVRTADPLAWLVIGGGA